jgi:hypothetical protein
MTVPIRFITDLYIEATAGQVVEFDAALAARFCALGYAEPVKRVALNELATEPAAKLETADAKGT